MSIEKSLERIADVLENISKLANIQANVERDEPEIKTPKPKRVKEKPAPETKAELAIDSVRAAAKLLIDAYPKKDRAGFKQAQLVLQMFGADKMVDLAPEKFADCIAEMEKRAKAQKGKS